MNTPTAVVIVVGLIVFGLLAWAYLRQKHSTTLRSRFGPEYDRQIHEHGNRRLAEAELDRRAERVRRLAIRPLPPDQRARYADQWRIDQARFVDDPKAAVIEAQHLVDEVMRRRGYPVGEFDQMAADISVDHPNVVQNYRAAHDIAARLDGGTAPTEDLRQAMVHYRALFEDLLEDRWAPATG